LLAARALALRFHRMFEAGAVDADASLGCCELELVDGVAERVVQTKCFLAADGLLSRHQEVLELEAAPLDRRGGQLLFSLEDAEHHVAALQQFRIMLGENAVGPVGNGRKEGFADLKTLSGSTPSHGSSEQPTKDVARALVSRQCAFGDRERQRTNVIRDHPSVAHRLPFRLRAESPRTCEHLVDDRLEDIRLEDRALPLDDQREALDPHAGVDPRSRQRRERAVRLCVELREHQVPEFHVAVALIPGPFAPERTFREVGGPRLAEIEVDLAARSARALASRRPPEIVRSTERDNVVRRHADLLPQRRRLVVAGQMVLALEDGGVHPLLRKLEHLGDELPGKGDRLLLEVGAALDRAEREVAQHLEECVVARSQADILEIGEPQTFLDRDRTGIGHVVAGRVIRLELDHARGGEEQGRVVGHERSRGNRGVPPRDEEVEEGATQLGRRASAGRGLRWAHKGSKITSLARSCRRKIGAAEPYSWTSLDSRSACSIVSTSKPRRASSA
jgi:hypothetical protein